MNLTPTELALQSEVEKREIARSKADEIIGMDSPSDTEEQHLTLLREEIEGRDAKIELLIKDSEADKVARDNARLARKAFLDQPGADEDGIVYRTFAEYARDEILTRGSTECAKVASALGSTQELEAASSRLELLKRVSNTLSSNVAGLNPPEHINQIFQVIDSSRPIVASATRTDLVRGSLTYPQVTTRPVVAEQASEKTAAGDQGMVVDMETLNAKVFLGGGDLSWQAVNWSTPSALDLWFALAAADYALKTERDAARVLRHSGYGHIISSPLSSTPTFADFMTAVGAGASAVYTASGRAADTVYMAPDRFWYIFGTTSTAFAQFANLGNQSVGPLNFVMSRGLDSGLMIVGDSDALLVAETPGAPVELRVVEPAIGGLEVGIIGAFASVVVDDGAFAEITTAS